MITGIFGIIWIIGLFVTWISFTVFADDFLIGFGIGIVLCAFWPILVIAFTLRKIIHGQVF